MKRRISKTKGEEEEIKTIVFTFKIDAIKFQTHYDKRHFLSYIQLTYKLYMVVK